MAIQTLLGLALLLAGQVAADNGWNVKANNKQDAAGQSNALGPNGPSDTLISAWWADFKLTYGRTFSTAAEEATAKANFKLNMLDVFKTNRDTSVHYWKSGNKFSDKDPNFLKAKMLMQFNPLATGRKLAEGEFVPEEPQGPTRRLKQTVVDWRTTGKVPAIRDQGQCGSCWAFAATATIESAYLIATGTTASSTPAINLSEQQLVSCATNLAGYGSYGCSGGYSDQVMKYVMNLNQTTEAIVPYTSGAAGANGTCPSSITTTAPGQVVKLASGNPVYYTRNSESALRAAVDKQPTVIYFMVANSFYSYAGGIYYPTDCTTSINHAMVAVGYSYTGNPANDYWIVRNSWGVWGESGYIKITMDGSTAGPCGMYTFNVAPSLSFTQTLYDVPSPSPPPANPPLPPSPSPPPANPPPHPPLLHPLAPHLHPPFSSPTLAITCSSLTPQEQQRKRREQGKEAQGLSRQPGVRMCPRQATAPSM